MSKSFDGFLTWLYVALFAVSKYAPLVLSFVLQVPPQLAYFLSLMLSILFFLIPSF